MTENQNPASPLRWPTREIEELMEAVISAAYLGYHKGVSLPVLRERLLTALHAWKEGEVRALQSALEEAQDELAGWRWLHSHMESVASIPETPEKGKQSE